MMGIANMLRWNLLFIDALDLEEKSVDSSEKVCAPFSSVSFWRLAA
jgi:hypothetical protein